MECDMDDTPQLGDQFPVIDGKTMGTGDEQYYLTKTTTIDDREQIMAWNNNNQTDSQYMITLKCWQEKKQETTDMMKKEVDKIERLKKEDELFKNQSLFSKIIGVFGFR